MTSFVYGLNKIKSEKSGEKVNLLRSSTIWQMKYFVYA